jgi:DNA sulfur modification protein DndD
MPDAQGLQEKRERIERDLKRYGGDREKTINQIRDLAAGSHFIIAQSAIEQACRVLEVKRERGEIPSSIRKQFVQDLIDRQSCICGRCIEAGTPEYERLLKLMHGSLSSALENDVLNTSAALQMLTERANSHLEDLNEAMQRRTELGDIVSELDAELDDVKRQLKGSPLEEISRLEAQRENFDKDVQTYTLEIGACSNQIKLLTDTIAQLDTAIAKAQKAAIRERLLSKKYEIAQQAADAIAKVYDGYADDMRRRIEAKTQEIFKLLIWKESHFQDIQLGSDYNLEVIDRYGLRARPELSAGERQVLSLSFITAMSRVSEEEAPLVMDTPFGRLSSQHRESITKHLPELTTQLVLFVTDEELRDQALENLKSYIGAEYRLEFNRNTSCTEIIEVG